MKPTILLFDSGMGGLSVYDAVRKTLPNAHYLYAFDNACFPYSDKPETVLIERALKIVGAVAQKFALDAVIVACNTASTIVLPALRARFSFPIVGTVPAIKPAVAISETKVIGLLATEGTIVRPYTLDLIEKYASDCVVEKIGSTDLPRIVEEKQRTGKVDMVRLEKVVSAWVNYPQLDTVILGCTHYPLVRAELQQLLPQVKYFVDSGNAIAKRTADLVRFHSKPQKDLEQIAFCAKKDEKFNDMVTIMHKWGFVRLAVLDV